MNETQKKMILDWTRKVHILEYAHRYESIYWTKLHNRIGMTAFIFSAIIALSFRLPGVDKEIIELPFFLEQNFVVAVLATAITILTGLQTFLQPSKKSITHKNTGSNYERLRHSFEMILTMEYQSWESRKRAEQIKKEWDNLDAINVSQKNFKKGSKTVEDMNVYPEKSSFLRNDD